MIPPLRRLRHLIPLKALGLAFIFGLFSVTVIAVGLTLHIPSTPITSDVGGVFATMGSALTGPVGGALIGLMTGLLEPDPHLRLFVVIDKILAGIWIGSLYWVILRRFRASTVKLFIAWVVLVFGYYYVARIPAFIGLKLLFPSSYSLLAAGSSSIPGTLAAVDTTLFYEAAIVAFLTGAALTVFPSAIRMPVWRSALDYKRYLAQLPQATAQSAFPRSLSIRLTIWLLLLSLLPVMVLSVFVWDDVTRLAYDQSARSNEQLASELAGMLSDHNRSDAPALLEPFIKKGGRTVWLVDRNGTIIYHPDSSLIGSSAFRLLDSSLVRRFATAQAGSATDDTLEVAVGFHRVQESGMTLVIEDPRRAIDLALHAFHRSSYLRLGASMLLISVIGGIIMLILVEMPLKRLTKATMQIAKGNFGVEVRELDLDDEIAVLGNRFNGMVRNLRSLRDGLETEIGFRRGIENQLRVSETKYRTIIEQSSEGILLVDSDGSVIEANRAGETILGIRREEMIGKKTWELLRDLLPANGDVEDSVTQFREATLGLLTKGAKGSEGTSEISFVRPDGRPVVLQQTIFPIRTEVGNRVGVILQDITGRKENERAVKRSEEKFSRVFHTTPDSITITKLAHGTYMDVNDGFTEMTGYSAEDVIGKKSSDIGIWYDPMDRVKLLNVLKSTGEVAGFDVRFRTKKNSVVHALLSARVLILDGEECLLLIARNVTERRRAEEALRESEERFRSVFEHAAVGICYASLDGRLLRVNDALCRITGYDNSELTKMSFSTLLTDSESVAELDDIASVLVEGVPSYTLTQQFNHKSGRTIWVNMTMSLIRDATGRAQSFIGIVENISERKKAEEEIEKSLREKELLLKEIHHRVKNNLQIISSLLNLQSETIRDSADRSLFRDSQDRIRSMALIHEKLYQTDDFSHVDFQQYLKSLLSSLFRSYHVPSVSCVEQIDDIRLNIDAAIPCGLIVNELVTNALKHAFPDGKRGEVRVSFSRSDGGKLVLEVSDNGVGMRAANPEETKEQLGLELVSILTNQIGGQLSIQHGRGTTFQITFSPDERRRH